MVKASFDAKTKTLTIVVDATDKPVPSTSGKTLVVASTHGNQPLTVNGYDKPVYVGVNAYIKP